MPVEIVDPLPLDAFFRPEHWPSGTGALMTTRLGGVSQAPFDSLNLNAQTSGPRVVRLTAAHASPDAGVERADASITTVPGLACTVMVADCLPVLFATRDGRAVGAAHAGWRGLGGGVLEATVAAIRAAVPVAAADIVAWLGASIGPGEFEDGAD